MDIKTPKKYISGAGVLKNAAEEITPFTKNPLFVGSPKALGAAWPALKASYEEAGLSAGEPLVFSGYPSEGQFAFYEEAIREGGHDGVVVLGGGRALDTAKAAAELAGVPVVTIPTIAATCAAWAALTVQYDDAGAFVQMRPLKETPVCIIADTEILFSAPVRYTYAGVVDTFAKFYENEPNIEKHPESICLNIGVFAAKFGFDLLKENTDRAVEEAAQGIFSDAAKYVADAIIYIAGFVGSFSDGLDYYSLAHPFYHVSTRVPGTLGKLHGEKVAFGIIAQHFLLGKDEQYIKETADLFAHYGNIFTWDDLGLTEKDVDFLKTNVGEAFPFVTWDPEDIKQALTAADRFNTAYKKGERL